MLEQSAHNNVANTIKEEEEPDQPRSGSFPNLYINNGANDVTDGHDLEIPEFTKQSRNHRRSTQVSFFSEEIPTTKTYVDSSSCGSSTKKPGFKRTILSLQKQFSEALKRPGPNSNPSSKDDLSDTDTVVTTTGIELVSTKEPKRHSAHAKIEKSYSLFESETSRENPTQDSKPSNHHRFPNFNWPEFIGYKLNKKLRQSGKNSDKVPDYKTYEHKRLMPNDRRKPLTYQSSAKHEYESPTTISGCISLYYHNMLDKDWWTIIVSLSVVYVTSILAFGIMYFVLEILHFKIFRKFNETEKHYVYPEACLTGVTDPATNTTGPEVDFVRTFLLSLESQTTIGYGGRHPTNHCIYPVILQTFQFLANLLLMGYMLMITSSRMMRSKSECDNLIRYSEFACIGLKKSAQIGSKDAKLQRVLVVRIANNNYQEQEPYFFQQDTECNLVGVSVTAKVLVTRTSAICDAYRTPTGWCSTDKDNHEIELIPLQEFEIKFENWQSLFGTTPIDFYHVINSDSPFYEIDKKDLDDKHINLEFIVITTATIASTGTCYMTKRSYVQSDIKWGYNFVNCIDKQNRAVDCYRRDELKGFDKSLYASRHLKEYVVDLEKYDQLDPLDNYPVSSKQVEDITEKAKNLSRVGTSESALESMGSTGSRSLRYRGMGSNRTQQGPGRRRNQTISASS